jgi:hypothetical protein
MDTSQKMKRSPAHPIPFPKGRETLAELHELDARFRSLREKIENGEDALSIARSTALLHVDFIARVHTFSSQLDTALENQLLLADPPFIENVRRASAALRIYERLSRLMQEATDGLFKCIGGQKVITLEAIDRYVAQNPEAGTAISALEENFRRIANTLKKQSK